jgi:hypothetical protein
MDLGGSPIRVLFRETPDQPADLIGDLRPALAMTRSPAPVQPKTGAMPADHGLRFHDGQKLCPPGPGTAECHPEQPVGGTQIGARTFPFEHGNLLSQGKDLKGGVAPIVEEDLKCGQEHKDEFDHERMVVTCRNAASAGQRLRTASR